MQPITQVLLFPESHRNEFLRICHATLCVTARLRLAASAFMPGCRFCVHRSATLKRVIHTLVEVPSAAFPKTMPIPFRHLLRLVPQPFVNQSLVDPFGRTVGRERVPEDVPAFDLIPFRALQRRMKVLVGFIGRTGQSLKWNTSPPAWPVSQVLRVLVRNADNRDSPE